MSGSADCILLLGDSFFFHSVPLLLDSPLHVTVALEYWLNNG